MIRCSELTKVYTSKRVPVHALRGVSFEIETGDYIVVHGPSGSGKSTLLNLIGLLDQPTSGKIILAGSDVAHLPERKRARIRNRQIGFVFQRFNLIPHLNAWRNVA
ncbi:MAG TPA: ATP-binding cassette domain-containing protein, partial [Candidatus Acetothermia bacterium]|nr:ATP-binding cassette domain-containing protein [Candidatus Acetothermia bacterium]